VMAKDDRMYRTRTVMMKDIRGLTAVAARNCAL
jgi:hypothetical protein